MQLRELSIRYAPLPVPIDRPTVTTPAEAARLLTPILDPEPVEVFGVLLLNTRRKVLAWHPLSRGTTDSTTVQPRDVIRAALLAHATGIIVAHNHPSGDPTPSTDDRTVTERIKTAADIFGIALVDHVIVAGETGHYFSFREGGLL
jgi:DNA repair protein RadC